MMASLKENSADFEAIQKALSGKGANVLFVRRVKFDSKQEKGGDRQLAVSTNRIYLTQTKSPYKIDVSFHILEIHTIEATKPLAMQLMVSSVSEKQANYAVKFSQQDDADMVIAHSIALLRSTFPNSNAEKQMKLKIEPQERLDKVLKVSDALAVSTSDTDVGLCGGFTNSYICLCDYYGQESLAEVVWDIDNIYASHNCKEFDIADFDHLEQKISIQSNIGFTALGKRHLVPVIATLEYNSWFRKLSCRSFRLGSDLVDVIIRVLKRSSTIEEIDLNDCHLSRENIQKLSLALTSNPKTGLKSLDLSKNSVEDRGAGHFCGALAAIPHGLESLLLEDVNITTKGAITICNSLRNGKHMQSTLTRLSDPSDIQFYFKGKDVSPACLKLQDCALCHHFVSQQEFRIKAIHELKIDASFCSYIFHYKQFIEGLTRLNLSSNSLKSEGCSAICEFLANSNVLRELNLSNSECALELIFGALLRGSLQHLEDINLSGNPYSYKRGRENQVAPSVQQFFASSVALKSVNLSNTRLSAEATKGAQESRRCHVAIGLARTILLGLISNTTVTDVSLDLSRNELRSTGAAEIGSCIAGVRNVTSLDLTDNGLDMDLIGLCQNMQQNQSLKHLSLSQNIGKSRSISIPVILETISDMMEAEKLPLASLSLTDCRLRQDASILIDSLGTDTSLTKLDISGNLIGDEGARLLAKALQINTKLRTIHLDRNGITLKGFEDIAIGLERNYSLQSIPVPVQDIAQIMKHNSDAITKSFRKIENLLLRNQSTDHSDREHVLILQQNLLLNSLDQQHTDQLLVKLQDRIADLRGIENDEAVTKEVGLAKEAMKDADKLKQILFKLYVDNDSSAQSISEKVADLTKEMTTYANTLVKTNMTSTLNYVKDQCSTIASKKGAMNTLQTIVSEHGSAVDGLGVKETISRLVVGQISYKVREATMQIASALSEALSGMIQDNLNESLVKMDLLADDHHERLQNKPAGSSVEEQDEAMLFAQKARNRLSTAKSRKSAMLPSDKKGSLKRRPTFKQRKSDASDSPVEIEISLDDSVSSDQGREASANSIDTGHVAGDQGREASADSIDARNVAGDIDFGSLDGPFKDIQALSHLNKSRVKPAKGRRPPTRLSTLAQMNPDAAVLEPETKAEEPEGEKSLRSNEEIVQSPKAKEEAEKAKPPSPTKPRPKSMQLATNVIPEETIVRAGTIPSKAKPSAPLKPAAKPKPPEKTKEKSRLPGGIQLPGFLRKGSRDRASSASNKSEKTHEKPSEKPPEKVNEVQEKAQERPRATSSASSKEKEASPKAKPRPKPSEKEKPKAEDKVEEKKEATEKVEIKEEDKEKEEEQQQQQEDKKPVPQKRPIPGARPGVPLPGAIGFGGDLLAEMKKRQSSTKAKKNEEGTKDKSPHPPAPAPRPRVASMDKPKPPPEKPKPPGEKPKLPSRPASLRRSIISTDDEPLKPEKSEKPEPKAEPKPTDDVDGAPKEKSVAVEKPKTPEVKEEPHPDANNDEKETDGSGDEPVKSKEEEETASEKHEENKVEVSVDSTVAVEVHLDAPAEKKDATDEKKDATDDQSDASDGQKDATSDDKKDITDVTKDASDDLESVSEVTVVINDKPAETEDKQNEEIKEEQQEAAETEASTDNDVPSKTDDTADENSNVSKEDINHKEPETESNSTSEAKLEEDQSSKETPTIDFV